MGYNWLAHPVRSKWFTHDQQVPRDFVKRLKQYDRRFFIMWDNFLGRYWVFCHTDKGDILPVFFRGCVIGDRPMKLDEILPALRASRIPDNQTPEQYATAEERAEMEAQAKRDKYFKDESKYFRKAEEAKFRRGREVYSVGGVDWK